MTRVTSLFVIGVWLVGCSAIVKFKDPPAGMCGDGVRQDWESCDGTDFGERSCHDYQFNGGVLVCEACEISTAQCSQGICGNNTVEPGEQCDGFDMGPDTCEGRGYQGGALSCTAQCEYDESTCTDVPCGDGYCDLAAGESHDSCSSDCNAVCPNGSCEVGRGEETATCLSDCAWQTVSVGHEFSCATRMDGSVWCWGSNNAGKLGNGQVDDARWPVRVQSIDGALILSAGPEHACVSQTGGAMSCWGHGGFGQLGYGSFSEEMGTPQAVLGGLAAFGFSAGADATCAHDDDGMAWCWGAHDRGQLGIGAADPGEVCGSDPCGDEPIQLDGISTVQGIAVSQGTFGTTHTCAISNGQAWCWGANDRHQGGHDGVGDATAVQVSGLAGLTRITAGDGFTCASDDIGQIRCWGENQYGQLGNDGTTPDPVWEPQQVLGLGGTGIFWLSAGRHHVCAVRSDHVLYCWGNNGAGQIGDGTVDNAARAVSVSITKSVTSVSAGSNHTCAVVADGNTYSEIWCWGANDKGQLGDGTQSNSQTPVQVIDPLPPDPAQ